MKRTVAVSRWPKLLRIPDETRQWSATLEAELGRWPGVTSRPMFGLMGFYRDGVIFACLPRTRTLGTPNSFLFKVAPMPAPLLRRSKKDPRIDSEREGPGARWHSFELNSPEDLGDALWWLERAYDRTK
jgi:hypothetical protein